MDINRKNRTELKVYFEKNKIPTQTHFQELIDGMLNHAEDGIAKVSGHPLSIQAEGDVQGLQHLIDFYGDFSEENPSWTINQNPRTDALDPNSSKPGFNISDASGTSRFFIKNSGGNIGISTITPTERLDVQGGNIKTSGVIKVDSTNKSYVRGTVGIGTTNPTERLQVQGGNVKISGVLKTDGTANSYIMGKTGIGTTNPPSRLSIYGTAADGWNSGIELNHAGSTQTKIISDNDGTKFRNMQNNRHFWFQDNDDNTALVIRDGSHVGINTKTPVARLDIIDANRTGSHPSAVKGLYVTGNFGAANDGVEFRHTNGTQGIGFGYNSIYATGTDASQHLNLIPRGTGKVGIGVVNPQNLIDMGGSGGKKLAVYQNTSGSDFYGFGIASASLEMHAGSTATEAPAFVLKNTGRVGIGSTNPGTVLDVYPNTDNKARIGRAVVGHGGYNDWAGFSHFDRNTAGNYALMQNPAGQTIMNVSSGQQMNFRENNVDRMVMRNSRLGIGTNNPLTPLQVGATIAHKGSHNFTNAGTRLLLNANTNNGGNSPSATESVLSLVREGISGQSYGNMADFRLGRYENNGSNSRSRMDIFLTEGSFSPQHVMSLRSNVSVGIGTTAPTNALEVRSNLSSGGQIQVRRSTSTAGEASIGFYNSSTGSHSWILGSGSWGRTNDFVIGGGGAAERLIIKNSTGRVGIGSTNPGTVLDVFPDTDNLGRIGRAAMGYMGHGDYAGFSHMDRASANNYALLQHSNGTTLLNSASGQIMYFQEGNATKMVLRSGKLGIGTVDPQLNLHVMGSMMLDTADGGGEEGIIFRRGYGTSNKYNLSILTYNHSTGSYPDGLSINAYDGVSFNTGSNSRQERMRIVQGGNVGIGTTNPGSKLHIMGKMDIHQSGSNGGQNRFTGVEGATTANGRAQLVLSSSYSDMVIASSQSNNNHGSTLTFAAYNPSNSGEHRKFVINQGGWGTRKQYLDFGYRDSTMNNPHNNINSTYTTLTLDGINRRVGIGSTVPRNSLDVKGAMEGTPNDYMKAQFVMSGGGYVTWGGATGRLKWTQRFIAISMSKGSTSTTGGHINIYQPTSNIPAADVYDGSARSATSAGVVLNGWEALYAVHTIGGNQSSVSFKIRRYTNDFSAPSNWLLVAVVNSDSGNDSVRLGTGVIINKNATYTNGSPIPRGVITMWSGAANNVPYGWALCNGSNGTPNLRGRFVLAEGSGGHDVGETGGAETHVLSANEMPQHNHGMLTRQDDYNVSGGSGPSFGADNGTYKAYWGTDYRGANWAHNNMPPFYVLAFIMKL